MLRTFEALNTLDPAVQGLSWFEKSLDWAAGKPWWADRDQSRQAIAQVSADRLSDLSEAGRLLRRDIRRQQADRQYTEKPATARSRPGDGRRPRGRSPKFLQAVTAVVDTFREAQELRRAAHKKYPSIDA